MRWRTAIVVGGLTGAAASPAALDVEAQGSPRLEIQREDGSSTDVSVSLDRGYAVVRLSAIEALGWRVTGDGSAIVLSAGDQITVTMRIGSPFFRWDGVVLQMTDAPYRSGRETFVPLQFLTDFLPRRLPGLYDFSGERSLLLAGDLDLLGGANPTPGPARRLPEAGDTELEVSRGDGRERATEVEDRVAQPFSSNAVRVVVIDPGHGGDDPGALGPEGIREKSVALGIALQLERALAGAAGIEVHMIRDDDSFVDLWERGQIATGLKGDRPGVFVSIHANSFPARREASGFETYFLSDARTEHERRVSAIENAPLSMSPDAGDSEQLADIDFILRDLRNYDHAHWSEDLATLVQEELDDFHPGPNRGVKQGVLAVLTNALMPSVLVEVGYLSNEEEGRMLGREAFHADAAEAIADAVLRFFERYPPGSAGGGPREER